MPLTDVQIRNTKAGSKPIKMADGGGLYLEIRPSGSKLWRYRYRIAGKENVYAIGDYKQIGLAKARKLRDEARELVKQGIHPAHARQTELAQKASQNANTFKAVALEWVEKRKSGWTPYYLKQVQRGLESDMFPYIGRLPIRSIKPNHILEILHRAEGRGAPTVAILLRQWTSAIFQYAVANLKAKYDPAAALKGAIKRPKVRHHTPLSRGQLADFVLQLDEYGGYRTTVIALWLMLLTFVRTKELREAEWTEFDLDNALWRIPAERMKMREPHLVPLSHQAVKLLRELKTLTGGQRWLFPNNRRPKTCMTATTLNRALERMGLSGKGSIGFSAHGFRATASTILNEEGYRSDVIERQLAHKERNQVRASYNQAEYLDERRTMMQDWSDMVRDMMGGA
jgi:integrase